MKFVASNSANIREKPSIKSKILTTYYKGQIITQIDGEELDTDGNQWIDVGTGYIYASCLNEYVQESDEIVPIPSILRTLGGVAQYILWDGKIHHNLCGEFCATYLGSGRIEYFLARWADAYPKEYNTCVTQDKPSGIPTVKTMLNVFGLEYKDVSECLTDKILGFFYSPERFRDVITQGWKLLCGVKIGNEGKINTNGSIGHWVVLTSVEPLRNGDGLVTIYNPFSNRMQTYSYAEFIKSALSFGSLTGLWVKNK